MFRKYIIAIAFFALLIVPLSAFCTEIHGWIKTDTCWVVKAPSPVAKIVGIIKKKAAVTVEVSESEYLKIVFAPVRDPQTRKWVDCKECYIEKSNFTTSLPNKW